MNSKTCLPIRIFACLFVALLYALGIAQQVVIIARDKAAGQELMKTWGSTRPDVVAKFKVVKQGTVEMAFETRLIDGDNPGWYQVALGVATSNIGKKSVRFSDLNPAEQAAMKKLLANSPVAEHHIANALRNPDLKLGFTFALKAEYQDDTKTVKDQFNLMPNGFAEDLLTPNLNSLKGKDAEDAKSRADQIKREEASETQDQVFVLGLTRNSIDASRLRKDAYEVLLSLQLKELERLNTLRTQAIERAISELLDKPGGWNGKSDIKAADLPEDLKELISREFLARSTSFGFSNRNDSQSFFDRSTVRNSRFELMISITSQTERGRSTVSWPVGYISP